ncbi:vesicular, overexpressed in cancer, prosurvival protein 1-like isoform X2 [Oncorhynchus kisutch]|uniref:vesicular, overexpressed in cancer, prosurvival protein 1-like isoform X2 n=1 Tax=Oncorhynchus kisutch TaxID=8019 RepID=UPI0012DDAE5E|nr:vesicular, overexpressed in cancer, prosurvival protein 1-like isoform X2 [Oncorhynchus kisutch]XP_031662560.1 vesicular, overexpressed in cancer, prosurvival protein 1-like isoform X2 [Oncorhynchus kisutch]XP_031662561.1 vesicular, overexpressed in cancer, prosurvival protein 1-like isoform X2 [Oncorhynchus kisutch]
MTKFDDKICPRRTAATPCCSSEHSTTRCRSYEDCCGTRCCVRALSIQRLWYFWLLLMMGVLFCCGAGFFIRRCMYPSPLPEDTFNVAFARHPMTAPGLQQASMQNYGDPGGMNLTPTFPYSPHPYPSHLAAPYPHPTPTPPAYCNLPPPPYEQVLQASEKR